MGEDKKTHDKHDFQVTLTMFVPGYLVPIEYKNITETSTLIERAVCQAIGEDYGVTIQDVVKVRHKPKEDWELED